MVTAALLEGSASLRHRRHWRAPAVYLMCRSRLAIR